MIRKVSAKDIPPSVCRSVLTYERNALRISNGESLWKQAFRLSECQHFTRRRRFNKPMAPRPSSVRVAGSGMMADSKLSASLKLSR